MKRLYQRRKDAFPCPADLVQAAAPQGSLGPPDRQPLREQLRRRGPPAERHPRRSGGQRSGRAAGLPPERAEARGADRHQLDAAARGLFRQPGRRRRRRSRRRAGRGDRARLRLARALARRVRRHGQGAGRRLGLGGADPLAARRPALQRLGGRPHAQPGRRHAGAGARHVRARLSPRLRQQRRRLCRCLHGQHRLGAHRRALRRRSACAAKPHTVDAPTARADARRRSRPAGDRRAPRRRRHDGAGRPARRAPRAAGQGRRGRRVAADAAPRRWSTAPGASRSAATAPRSCASAASTPSASPAASAPGAPTACPPNRSRKEKRHEMGHPRTSQDRPHRLPVADHALHRQGSRSSSTCRPPRC